MATKEYEYEINITETRVVGKETKKAKFTVCDCCESPSVLYIELEFTDLNKPTGKTSPGNEFSCYTQKFNPLSTCIQCGGRFCEKCSSIFLGYTDYGEDGEEHYCGTHICNKCRENLDEKFKKAQDLQNFRNDLEGHLQRAEKEFNDYMHELVNS